MTTAKSSRLPAIFFGHGSPMNTLADNRYTQAWRRLGEATGKPKAILMISAHWFTRGCGVTAMERPKTIHDFYGFPQELFDVQYPAPGDPALAARVVELLRPAEVALDHSWGLDHGTWSVLKHAYPDADVPVVQLSIDGTQPASFHYAQGAKLSRLRDEGVLIAGSGNVVHNLGVMRPNNGSPYDWAVRFNDYVRDAIATDKYDRLVAYDQAGQDARLAVPTPEHYLPLLYVLGAQRASERARMVVDGLELSAIGMLTVEVGGAAS